jgi:2-polyprenyl-3-methyl-5-hydroxy-6-metoxy-1,4-benzoquinol methylase
LSALSKHRRNGKLLDIGCGAGYFLQKAKRSGWSVCGIEFSSFAAARATRNAQCEVCVGDLRSAILEGSVFDVVTMWYVLEHVVGSKELLEETWKVIKEDGLLLVSVPNVEYLLAKTRLLSLLGRKQNVFHLEEHLQHFSLKTLGRMLTETGFSVVEELVAKPFDVRGSPAHGKKSIAYYLLSLLFSLTGRNLGGLMVIAKKKAKSAHSG